MKSLLVATCQPQVTGAVTATVPVPPAASKVWLVGAIEVTQTPEASCDTVTVAPATVNVPVRGMPVLAATVAVTLPLPVPFAPLVIVMKLALLMAVQVQPAFALTGVVSEPPPASTVRFN